MRDSVVFYRSFWESIKEIEKDHPDLALKVYNVVFEYALNENELDIEGTVAAIFKLIRPQIDSNNKKRENGKKGGEYGKLGGRPPQENPKETPSEPQENPTETPNVNVNVNANGKEKKNTKKKFVPPTLDEVRAYCQERNSSVDPKAFFDYFQAGNWIDSKGKPVVSWKQKLITWESHNEKPKNDKIHFENERTYDFDELERKIIEKQNRRAEGG